MKIYLTRHGQVCPSEFFGSTDFPTGDIPLTELGQKQAKFLGTELKKTGFSGKIISSPYRRTMMTSNIAAGEADLKVYMNGELREIFFSDEAANEFVGMNLEELKKEFPNVAEDAVLPFPWWTKNMDNKEIVADRLEKFWDETLSLLNEDILVVGHGASVFGTMNYFNKKFDLGFPTDLDELGNYLAERNLNCNLSYFEIDNNGKLLSARLFYTEHLPEGFLTSNGNPRQRPEIYTKK